MQTQESTKVMVDDEVDLLAFGSIFLRRSRFIISCLIVGSLVAFCYTQLSIPIYQGITTFIIPEETDASMGKSSFLLGMMGSLGSQGEKNKYLKVIFGSRRFHKAVENDYARQFNISTDDAELILSKGKIKMKMSKDKLLYFLVYEHINLKQIVPISKLYLEQLENVHYELGLSGVKYDFRVVDHAMEPLSPKSLLSRNIIISLFFVGIISFMIVALDEYTPIRQRLVTLFLRFKR